MLFRSVFESAWIQELDFELCANIASTLHSHYMSRKVRWMDDCRVFYGEEAEDVMLQLIVREKACSAKAFWSAAAAC